MNTFETFWNAYDKKVGIDKCTTKWALVSANDQILIMNHVHKFVAKHRNKQYRPNPLSYLNGKMWLDEPVNEDQTLVYKMPKPPTLSNHKSEVFERSEFIAKLREKIKGYYNSGKIINDFGGAVTSFLKKQCAMSIPEDIKQDIERDCIQEKERERNRFEDVYSGTIEGDVRDLCLKWWLTSMKEQGIDVIEKI